MQGSEELLDCLTAAMTYSDFGFVSCQDEQPTQERPKRFRSGGTAVCSQESENIRATGSACPRANPGASPPRSRNASPIHRSSPRNHSPRNHFDSAPARRVLSQEKPESRVGGVSPGLESKDLRRHSLILLMTNPSLPLNENVVVKIGSLPLSSSPHA